MRRLHPFCASACTLIGCTFLTASASAALTKVSQFNPSLGLLVSCTFDPATQTVWIYPTFHTTIFSFTAAGAPIGSIPRPGEAANDVDLEIAPEALTMGRTLIPAGTLLFINGESGVAEIYAVNSTTGAVLATLVTQFGASHVVGGAYHAERNTFFLVQDQVPGGSIANRIAEIDPATGAVLNSFQTTPSFVVNYGDVDVDPVTGNLLVVSDVEPEVGEFTPTGTFLGNLPLPAGVAALSGIGRFEGASVAGDGDACGQAWVSSTSGLVSLIAGFASSSGSPDINGDTFVDGADLGLLLGAWGDCTGCCPADLNGDGTVDGADLGLLLGAWT